MSTSPEPSDPFASLPSLLDVLRNKPKVPKELIIGVPCLRIKEKNEKQYPFRIDPEQGVLTWKPKPTGRISIEKIKEIVYGDDAEQYYKSFGLEKYKAGWITIVYNEDETKISKQVHFVTTTIAFHTMFVDILEKLRIYQTAFIKGLALIPGNAFAYVHWYNLNTTNSIGSGNDHKEAPLKIDDIDNILKKLHINCSPTQLKQLFDSADADHNGSLIFDEFKSLVHMIKSRPGVDALFWNLVRSHPTSIASVTNDETPKIGNDSIKDPKLSYEQFKDFLKYTQKENFDDDTIKSTFNEFAVQPKDLQSDTNKPESEYIKTSDSDSEAFLDLDAFNNYLLSSRAYPFKGIPQDLSHPLNEYYIASSHNTYLLGRQVIGTSTTETYKKVLSQGCRCVELDIWDDDKAGPVISHGRSFTSSVSLREVIETINKYAFVSSDLPIILSLEIHCTIENQNKAREIMEEIFGNKLIIAPIPGCKLPVLPSPDQLRNKVLVKVKSTKKPAPFEEKEESTSESSTSSSSEDGNAITSFLSKKLKKEKGPNDKKHTPSKISEHLAELGTYIVGTKFVSLKHPDCLEPTHCFSFSEKRFNGILLDKAKLKLLEEHNKKYILRVYPSATRLRSSNFSPCDYWKYGAQVVATNWQKWDLGQELNESMFESAKCGFVLKPQKLQSSVIENKEPATTSTEATSHLSSSAAVNAPISSVNKIVTDAAVEIAITKQTDVKVNSTITPISVKNTNVNHTTTTTTTKTAATITTAANHLVTLTIKIISAKQLLKPKSSKRKTELDPYVVVSLHGPQGIEDVAQVVANSPSSGYMVTSLKKSNARTIAVSNNSFNPVWNSTFTFKISLEDLDFTFLRLVVMDDDESEVIGSWCGRIVNLKQGYRWLDLKDSIGEPTACSNLFVKLKLEE